MDMSGESLGLAHGYYSEVIPNLIVALPNNSPIQTTSIEGK